MPAYQDTSNAYQGTAQFAYQTADPVGGGTVQDVVVLSGNPYGSADYYEQWAG